MSDDLNTEATEPNREKTVRFRVTGSEKEAIEAKSNAAGFKNISDYLRQVSLRAEVKEALPPEIRRQLVGLGTNINQIARLSNSGKVFPQHEKQLIEVVELIRKYLI